MAAADVAQAVAEVSMGAPLQGIRNVAGPEVFALDELGRITLAARGDQRTVVDRRQRRHVRRRARRRPRSPATDAVIAPTAYREWLGRQG